MRDRGHNDANIILTVNNVFSKNIDANIILSVNNVFSRNIMENLILRDRIKRPGPKNENVNIIFLILKINGEALNIYHLRRFNKIRAKYQELDNHLYNKVEINNNTYFIKSNIWNNECSREEGQNNMNLIVSSIKLK